MIALIGQKRHMRRLKTRRAAETRAGKFSIRLCARVAQAQKNKSGKVLGFAQRTRIPLFITAHIVLSFSESLINNTCIRCDHG